MKRSYRLGLLVLSLCLVLAGCKASEPKAPAEKQYPIKGKVIAVNPDQPSVKLDHEDIPGLMRGMEMEFAVENSKALSGLKAGDRVEGYLKVESGKYVITA